MKEAVKEKQVRRSEGQWRSLLARYQTGGLGVREFCRGERISEANFYRWRNRLNDSGDGRDAVVGQRTPTFLDLGTLRSAAARPGRIEIKLELGEGLTLHLVRG